MTGGAIPTPEFNEQLKRTVRESIRRERSVQQHVGRWHKNGSGGDRKLVMLCSDLPGRSETTGYGGGVMGAVSQAAGAELIIDPDTGAVIVSDRRYTVDNIWDIDLVRGQYVAIEKGLIGTNWTPYAADCGRVTGSESWWEDYAASTFGCTDSEWNG